MDNITKGDRAQELLDNAVFKEAVEGVRKALHHQWEQAPIRDIEGQQVLKLELKLLNDLIANIRSMAQSGKLERHEKTLKEKVTQFVRR